MCLTLVQFILLKRKLAFFMVKRSLFAYLTEKYTQSTCRCSNIHRSTVQPYDSFRCLLWARFPLDVIQSQSNRTLQTIVFNKNAVPFEVCAIVHHWCVFVRESVCTVSHNQSKLKTKYYCTVTWNIAHTHTLSSNKRRLWFHKNVLEIQCTHGKCHLISQKWFICESH